MGRELGGDVAADVAVADDHDLRRVGRRGRGRRGCWRRRHGKALGADNASVREKRKVGLECFVA